MSANPSQNYRRRNPVVTVSCILVGCIGLLTTFNLAHSLQSLNAFEDNSYATWLVASVIANPLCWVGAYGVYRLKRV